jgi:hypothetical protein
MLQFVIACAINERMQRKLDYRQECRLRARGGAPRRLRARAARRLRGLEHPRARRQYLVERGIRKVPVEVISPPPQGEPSPAPVQRDPLQRDP